MIRVASETIAWDKGPTGTTSYDILINGVKKSSTVTALKAPFTLSDGDVVRVVSKPSGEWQEITFDYKVDTPLPPPPPPVTSINSWEYALGYLQPRVSNPKVIDVTTLADLNAKIAAIQPGQSIRGHNIAGTYLDIRDHVLPNYAEIDLTDNCVFTGKGPSGEAIFHGWNRKLHLFGGVAKNFGIRIYSPIDCAIMDGKSYGTQDDGVSFFGIDSPCKRSILRWVIENCGSAATDPHPEPGTGIHGLNIGDSNSWVEDCRIFVDILNQNTGAGIEASNCRKGIVAAPDGGLLPTGIGVEFWINANGLLFKSQHQTAGNGIQLWGGSGMDTNAVRIHYINVVNAQGRVVEAGWATGPFSGVNVEFGRGHNVVQNKAFFSDGKAYKTYPGMTYGDCLVV